MTVRERLIRFVHEYAPDVILVLGAIAIFVVLPPLFRGLFPDAGSQASVDLALKILGTAIAVTASIASYRRFFRGRLFAPRLKLDLNSHAVCPLSDGTILHAADVAVDNVGGVTVWNPAVTLHVKHLDRDEDCAADAPATDGIRQPLKPGGLSGIEPAETAVYHYSFRVPADVEAFRISAELSIDGRDAWHRAITVANAVKIGH